MGNSFGYFSNKQDDEKVLTTVGKMLRPTGQLVLDITDGAYMAEHFERRSWEWIDEHHFVCRERSFGQDRERLISREVIVHDEMGVIADQFYAERLYTGRASRSFWRRPASAMSATTAMPRPCRIATRISA